MKTEKLTYERANESLRYDAETGKLYWRVNRGGRAKYGDEAGCVLFSTRSRTPYRVIRVYGGRYLAHRIAWLLHYGVWPKQGIDHIDGDGLNNRIGNLRDVPASINHRNARKPRNNTSGVTGVSWHKQAGKWQAQVGVDGKIKSLGLYTEISDAEAVVQKFRARHGFTERHGDAS